MDDLKRCPFCGSVAILDEIHAVKWKGDQCKPIVKYIAQCIIPSCVGHHGKAYVDEQTAIDKWNARYGERLPEEKVEEIKALFKAKFDLE